MRLRRLLLVGFLLANGCTWPVRQNTNQMVCRMANQPYDIGPASDTKIAKSSSDVRPSESAAARSQPAQRNEFRSTTDQRNESRSTAGHQAAAAQAAPVDVRTAAWLESPTARRDAPAGEGGVQAVAWTQPQNGPESLEAWRLKLNIPVRLPGSEAPPVEELANEREIERMYPDLPPLPVEPRMLPGPDGKAYTLTDLQRIAAAYSPALRQAAADVQRTMGAVVQARTTPNPTGMYFVDPTNNNATTGVQGFGIDQVIRTGGKQKLMAAAAQKDYENAQLALRRARNDLATSVRTAYFALLVDKETLAVTRAVAHFTDEMYRLQTELVRRKQAAPYEPASLRSQAFTTRLAYQQAIATYIYDWKSLVAILGMQQLPLTEVAGRIDRFIPYYDYDEVLVYTLRNHTDIQTARNLVPQAKYNLKFAQVTRVPDVDVGYKFARDFTVAPFGTYQQFQFQMPLAVWDRNKGNIIAAQAALIRATEEQHNAEMNLTNRLADAYTNYKNNLYAIEYYRRYILPDLVRYYRGVHARRRIDPEDANVGDLAFAQQNLSQNVTAYLGVLGNLWSSVVAVADFLQTDDLFQMATPRPLPELPDFDELSRWACGHAHVAASCGVGVVEAPGALKPTAVTGPQTARGREGEEARGRTVGSPTLLLSHSPPRQAPVHTMTIQRNSRRTDDK